MTHRLSYIFALENVHTIFDFFTLCRFPVRSPHGTDRQTCKTLITYALLRRPHNKIFSVIIVSLLANYFLCGP